MLYWFLWGLIKFSLKLAFRKIAINGLDRIPKDTPIIFTSNHPAAFMEPLVLATHMQRSLYYLARGDIFKKPIARWLLNQIHILPIYRFRDGFSNLRNSDQAMQNAIALLEANKCFLVFAEGSTKLQRSIRPMQKGVARIAHKMLTQFPDSNLAVVPIGYTVSNLNKLGSTVFVNIGEPIFPSEVLRSVESKPIFLRKLTGEIENASYNEVPQLKSAVDEDLLEQLISILPHSKLNFTQLKSASDHINQLDEVQKKIFSEDVLAFKNELGISNRDTTPLFSSFPILQLFMLIIGMIPALIGKLIHFIPMLLAKAFTKAIVTMKEFYLVTLFLSRIVLIFITYLLLYGLLRYLGINQSFLVVCALGLLGIYASYYFRELTSVLDYFRLLNKKQGLQNQYNRITDQIYAQVSE